MTSRFGTTVCGAAGVWNPVPQTVVILYTIGIVFFPRSSLRAIIVPYPYDKRWCLSLCCCLAMFIEPLNKANKITTKWSRTHIVWWCLFAYFGLILGQYRPTPEPILIVTNLSFHHTWSCLLLSRHVSSWGGETNICSGIVGILFRMSEILIPQSKREERTWAEEG